MSEHVEGLLSEWLDRTLPAPQHARVEKHLLGCTRCREMAEQLRHLSHQARNLPETAPARDLWPEIEGALEPRRVSPNVTRLHPGPRRLHTTPARPKHRIRLTGLQALAAGLACALLGGAGVSWGTAAYATGDAPPVAQQSEGSAMLVSDLPATLAQELEELESALAALQDDLSPETAAVLRKNLDLIDGALRASRAALAGDPTDPYLREHLEGIAQRKASLIRTAVRANGPASIGP